jgi:transcriptional regulator with XRE-family HTH domain
MVKRPGSREEAAPHPDPLWVHVGRRLQLRRTQLGIKAYAAASHVEVPLQTYEAYEAGEILTPAALLAQLGELLRVPIFYFFQDAPFGNDKAVVVELKPPADYAVATEADRVLGLITDFHQLDFERQQHLLLLARELVKDASRSR